MKVTNWAIDIDGVITANPAALSWLTYHLLKNENRNNIFILSWRNGADELTKIRTIEELKRFNIYYNQLILAPKRLTIRGAAYWKIANIKKRHIDIWVDDELKIYKRDYGIDLDLLLPEVIKIWI